MVVRGSTFALSVLCLWWMPSALHDLLSCSEYSQTTLRVEGEASTSQLPITTEQVKRVAIIGAGTAGLAALKTFAHDIPKPDGQRWEVELFEQRSSLGGIWPVLRLFSSTLASYRPARFLTQVTRRWFNSVPASPRNTTLLTTTHKHAHSDK